ncbi:MAG: bifunctional homocysteine S-methyltransferase/methylenetetrahydrofolate reductase [Candidatus Cloacimonadota bacterium]|nr:MAG: bifunctional homocysteine S-methyltransferase/methylenetetrahydrofolate reductase [Candidatus Cloacimonadota bacterium]
MELAKYLERNYIIADGAMGTTLYKKGFSSKKPFAMVNIDNPGLVMEIHTEFVEAGVELLVTNTFDANIFKLDPYVDFKGIREVNKKGAELAKKVAGDRKWVAGSVGPSGKTFSLLEQDEKEWFKESLIEQVEGLIDGGVDVLLVETQIGINEALFTIDSIEKNRKGVPIIISFSFTEGLRTPSGETVERVIDASKDLSLLGIGANHGIGPLQFLELMPLFLEKTNAPVCFMPNSGVPRYIDGTFVFPASSEHFARYAREFIKKGIKIVGGCCGTTPDYIHLLVSMLKSTSGRSLHFLFVEEEEVETQEIAVKEKVKNIVEEQINSKSLVVVEVSPPKGAYIKKSISWIEKIKEFGVDAVSILDSPMARVRMNPVAFSHLVKERGLESIPHFALRDRSLTRIQSDLIAACALGLNNIFAISGDPPSLGDYPQSTAVYDITSPGLIKLIKLLNTGKDFAGNEYTNPTSFYVGAAINPSPPDLEKEIAKINEKIEVGTDYFVTQPLFDSKTLFGFTEKVNLKNIPLVLNIFIPRSKKQFEYIAHEVPGIQVPENIMKMVEEKEDWLSFLQDELVKVLVELKPIISGLYVAVPRGRTAYLRPFMEEIKGKKWGL